MYQHCLPWGRLTEHAQSEHRQNVCMRKRESEWERGRERGAGGGRNQLFSIIKNATSKVELPQLSTSVWRMKSGLEPWGMLACMTFINLITEILIWGRERGGGAETPPLSFERKGFVKAIIDAGPKLGQNVAHVSSPSGSWMETPRLEIERGSFGDGWCPQTYCRISLTSVVSLFLIEENSLSMGLGVILKGAKC